MAKGSVALLRAKALVRATAPVDSHALGEGLKAHVRAHARKTVDQVYWQFPAAPATGSVAPGGQP